MLIFIKNEPRAYAWGSTEALPEILLQAPTGLPQAELWLGDHEVDPAEIATGVTAVDEASPLTLIDLIESDPELYGVAGGSLPFLFKLLGIGAPLSLQVHPNKEQAAAGFAREEAAGVPIASVERSYRDANHKPELVVALSELRALAGWRPIGDVVADLNTLAGSAGTCGAPGAQPFFAFAVQMATKARESAAAAREAALDWIFSGAGSVAETVSALETIVLRNRMMGIDRDRVKMLEDAVAHHAGDPGLLVTLFMNVKTLAPGEAMFVPAGKLHAYLSGVAVEVMASSDNVLRAGLTSKPVDVAGVREVLDMSDESSVEIEPYSPQPGLTVWEPGITDFSLRRIRVHPKAAPFDADVEGGAPEVTLTADAPIILTALSGRIRVERQESDTIEVASVGQGQSLYISSGGNISFSGTGEAFAATVGKNFKPAL